MNTNQLMLLDVSKMVEKMSAYMEEKFEDYKTCKQEFDEAMHSLRLQLGDEPVDRLLDNINKRCAADLLFCSCLGYQANLNNFKNPIARTFLDADFEDYLRMDVLTRMPQRIQAEDEIDAFYHLIPEGLQGVHDAISSYLEYMELNLTKLSHYIGFMIANGMLCYTEPGYCPNLALTLRYKNFLNEWYQVEIDIDRTIERTETYLENGKAGETDEK